MLNSTELLIKGVCASGTIETEGIMNKMDFKRQRTQELKQKWIEKRMYGQFLREMPEKVGKNKTWDWLIIKGSKGRERGIVVCCARTSYQNKLRKTPH